MNRNTYINDVHSVESHDNKLISHDDKSQLNLFLPLLLPLILRVYKWREK